ncbi:hypothetical protein, partial [uncultured Brachyspira sp.]|uniref:hypothetical protein n=1 Tax=uncultured Brachyspira sp. TaxID=221953 RepID=UPI002603A187
IKNLLDKYNIILDLFIINASGDIQKQYSEILSEKSIFKMYNTSSMSKVVIFAPGLFPGKSTMIHRPNRQIVYRWFSTVNRSQANGPIDKFPK